MTFKKPLFFNYIQQFFFSVGEDLLSMVAIQIHAEFMHET